MKNKKTIKRSNGYGAEPHMPKGGGMSVQTQKVLLNLYQIHLNQKKQKTLEKTNETF